MFAIPITGLTIGPTTPLTALFAVVFMMSTNFKLSYGCKETYGIVGVPEV